MHGIHDFLTRDEGDYLPKLAILKEGKLGYVRPFKAKPFWETASEQGQQCTILRWPLTFPARPLNGTILTGLGTPDIRGTLGRYTFFTTTAGRESSKGRVVKVDVVAASHPDRPYRPLFPVFQRQKRIIHSPGNPHRGRRPDYLPDGKYGIYPPGRDLE